MSEIYSHREGQLYAWTGSHTASGSPRAYILNANLSFAYGWRNERSIGTARYEWSTDNRVDLSVTEAWQNRDWHALADQTAEPIHFKLEASGIGGSAGWALYSGRIDSLQLFSTEGDVGNLSLAAHAFQWTGY